MVNVWQQAKVQLWTLFEGQWVFRMVEQDFLVFRVPDHQQETLVTSAQVHLSWHRDHF